MTTCRLRPVGEHFAVKHQSQIRVLDSQGYHAGEIWRPVGPEIVAEHSHRLAKTALDVRSLVGQNSHESPASPLRFGECRSPHVLSTSRFVAVVWKI